MCSESQCSFCCCTSCTRRVPPRGQFHLQHRPAHDNRRHDAGFVHAMRPIYAMVCAARRQLRPTRRTPRADLRAKRLIKTPPCSTCPWASAPAPSQTARPPHRRGGARAQSERGTQERTKRTRRGLRSAPASTRLWRSASRGGPWRSYATLCSGRAHTTLTRDSFQTRRVAGTAERRSSAPHSPHGMPVCGVAVQSVRCAMHSNVMALLCAWQTEK